MAKIEALEVISLPQTLLALPSCVLTSAAINCGINDDLSITDKKSMYRVTTPNIFHYTNPSWHEFSETFS